MYLEKGKNIIDLSKTMDSQLRIYKEGEYSDPEFSLVPWCTVEEQGYAVEKLSLGTQTGTHLDAPAHFKSDGATIDKLPLNKMIGKYFFVDCVSSDPDQHVVSRLSDYDGEPILFLFAGHSGATLHEKTLLQLLALPCTVWVAAGNISIKEKHSFHFYHLQSKHGKFLVDNVDLEAAKEVKAGGELIACPLPIPGAAGTPCRVLVIQ